MPNAENVVLEVEHPDGTPYYIELNTAECTAVLSTYNGLSDTAKRQGLSASQPVLNGYHLEVDNTCDVDDPAPPTVQAQMIGSVLLLGTIAGAVEAIWPMFNAANGTTAPAYTASNAYFVKRVGSETFAQALARVRAGGVTTYNQSQVSNILTNRAQAVGNTALLFDVNGVTKTGFPMYDDVDDNSDDPATSASNVYFVERASSGETMTQAVTRVRAGGVTKYTQSQVTNVRAIPSNTATGLPTKKDIMYNLMLPDGNGYDNITPGVFIHDGYGTVDYGTHPAYVTAGPFKLFSMIIPMGQYITPTGDRRKVVYENLRNAMVNKDAYYVVRGNFTWESISDAILDANKVARFHDGSVAEEGGTYMAKLYELRNYVNGGMTDTNNFWHHGRRYLRTLVTDFAPHLASKRCLGMLIQLTARLEEGYGKKFTGQGSQLLLSDYSAGSIQDFKDVTGQTENPPAPGDNYGDNAFTGSVGQAWYKYREDLYDYFKAWVKSEILSIVSTANVGDDLGQLIDREAMAMGQINYPRWAQDHQIFKVNPARDQNPLQFSDLFRANVPTTSWKLIEFDQDFLLNNPQDTANESVRNVDQVADQCRDYYLGGNHVISLGQLGYRSGFAACIALYNKLNERGYLGQDAVVVPVADSAHTVQYTSTEALYSPSTLPYDRRLAAGGSDSQRVDIKLIYNL